MARSFSGSQNLSSVASLSPCNGALTVACWAKYTSLSSAGGNKSNTLVGQMFGFFSWGDEMFALSLDGSKFVRLCWYSTGSSDVETVSTSSASVNAGEWHHYAATRTSGSSPTVKFYLDGVQLGSNVSASGAAGSFGNMSIVIGQNLCNASSGFTGSIAEVGIWTSVLSTEISVLAAGRPPAFAPKTNLFAAIPLQGSTSNEYIEGQSTTMNLNGTSAAAGPSQLNYTSSAPTEQLGSLPLHEVEVCPY